MTLIKTPVALPKDGTDCWQHIEKAQHFHRKQVMAARGEHQSLVFCGSGKHSVTFEWVTEVEEK